MKKICLTLFALLLASGLFSQEPVVTKGVIKQVTVYRDGAFASAEAPVKVAKGPNIVEVRGLPLSTNTESIQVGGKGVFTINSITNGIYYRDTDTLEKKSKAYILRQKIDSLTSIIQDIRDENAVLQNDFQLLINNQSVASGVTGLKLVDLKSAMAYFGPRFLEIKLAEIKNSELIETLQTKISVHQKELNELSNLGEKELSLIIDLTAENNEPILLTLDFLMTNCGWSPSYDVRTDGISDKLNIAYKASVWQKTGIDWNKVDFALSTGNPSLNNNFTKAYRRYYTLEDAYKPIKNKGKTSNTSGPVIIGTQRTLPAYVASISGIITDGKEPIPYANVILVDRNNKQLGGAQTDIEGKFKLPITSDAQLIRVSYIGFKTVTCYLTDEFINITLPASATELQYVEVSYDRLETGKKEAEKPTYTTFNNLTTTEFKISTPYTILSDGKANQVEINNTDFKAQYEYYAAPELNQNVFLTAKMMEFENAGYENGPLNVFLNGGFVASTSLVLPKTNDTATVSLGYDKGIVMNRERVKNKSKVTILGSKKEEIFAYTTTLKNTKNAPVQIQVQEQIPIAKSSNVSVSKIKYENATYDENTGILTWWITVKPKEKTVLSYEYVISCPSKWNIAIY